MKEFLNRTLGIPNFDEQIVRLKLEFIVVKDKENSDITFKHE
jgi:hypothetical protein